MVFIDSGISHSKVDKVTMGIWVFVTFHVIWVYQKGGGGGWGVKSWGGGGREFGPYPFRDGKMPNEQVLTT